MFFDEKYSTLRIRLVQVPVFVLIVTIYSLNEAIYNATQTIAHKKTLCLCLCLCSGHKHKTHTQNTIKSVFKKIKKIAILSFLKVI